MMSEQPMSQQPVRGGEDLARCRAHAVVLGDTLPDESTLRVEQEAGALCDIRPAHAIDMANSKEVQHMTFRIREELESGQSELPHQSEVLGRIDADRDNPDVSLFETIET